MKLQLLWLLRSHTCSCSSFLFPGGRGDPIYFFGCRSIFLSSFFDASPLPLKRGCQETPNMETISELNLARNVGGAIVGITAPIDSKFPSHIPRRANSPHLRHCVSSNVAWTPRWDSKVLWMIGKQNALGVPSLHLCRTYGSSSVIIPWSSSPKRCPKSPSSARSGCLRSLRFLEWSRWR